MVKGSNLLKGLYSKSFVKGKLSIVRVSFRVQM